MTQSGIFQLYLARLIIQLHVCYVFSYKRSNGMGPVLQECRSAGMVVLQTTVARNGGPNTYSTRNVRPTRPLILITLVRDGPTKLKMIGPPNYGPPFL